MTTKQIILSAFILGATGNMVLGMDNVVQLKQPPINKQLRKQQSQRMQKELLEQKELRLEERLKQMIDTKEINRLKQEQEKIQKQIQQLLKSKPQGQPNKIKETQDLDLTTTTNSEPEISFESDYYDLKPHPFQPLQELQQEHQQKLLQLGDRLNGGYEPYYGGSYDSSYRGISAQPLL